MMVDLGAKPPGKTAVGFGKGKPSAEWPAPLTKRVNRFLRFAPPAISRDPLRSGQEW